MNNSTILTMALIGKPANVCLCHGPTFQQIVKWGDIEQRGDIGQSYPFHGNSLISASNRHVTRCLRFRLYNESFCFPQPQNILNVPTTFDLVFLPKRQLWNEKNWCLETKLWSKVIFSQRVHLYEETSALFVHVCHRLLLFWQEKLDKVFSS